MQQEPVHTVVALTALFVLALFASAAAAPFDGPRETHSYKGEVIPLYPVPGAFSVTWEPGIEEHWRSGQPPRRGPKHLQTSSYRLNRGDQRGPARYHTDEYRLDRAPELHVSPRAVALELMKMEGVQIAAPLYRRSLSERAPTRAVTPRLLLQLRNADDEERM